MTNLHYIQMKPNEQKIVLNESLMFFLALTFCNFYWNFDFLF